MKIVHLCLGNFFIDNYSYQENIMPKYHVKMGYDVTVIASLESFDTNGLHVFLKEESVRNDKDGFKVIRIGYKKDYKIPLNRTIRRYRRLYELLVLEKPDIIFSHNIAFWDIRKVIQYLKSHSNVDFYCDNHADYINSGTNFLSKNILHKVIWRSGAKLAVPYIIKSYGVTPLRCDFLTSIYQIPKEKVELLVMGVDDDLIPVNRIEVRNNIRAELGIDDNDYVIATGGKIDKRKNIHLLIQAISKINNNNIHLILFGNIIPEMRSAIMPLISSNIRIHYVGWCNATQIMNYLITSDLVCFPGTHSTLWEQSVGLGIPAVFKHWGMMEHVNVCDNCLLIDGDNLDEIRTVIESLIFTEEYYKLLKNSKEASKSFLYSEISKKAIGLC